MLNGTENILFEISYFMPMFHLYCDFKFPFINVMVFVTASIPLSIGLHCSKTIADQLHVVKLRSPFWQCDCYAALFKKNYATRHVSPSTWRVLLCMQAKDPAPPATATAVDPPRPMIKTVIVNGEAGIGKTRVLDSFIAMSLRRNMRIMTCTLTMSDVEVSKGPSTMMRRNDYYFYLFIYSFRRSVEQ